MEVLLDGRMVRGSSKSKFKSKFTILLLKDSPLSLYLLLSFHF